MKLLHSLFLTAFFASGGGAMHDIVDFDKWQKVFPLEAFEKREGPRKFDTTKPGDQLDLWKARGQILTSPPDLSCLEQVKKRVASKYSLRPTSQSDIFLWGVGEPKKPFLTKVGGVPYWPKDKPWPKATDGQEMTFVFQVCFRDSLDLIKHALPGEVILFFAQDEEFWAYDPAENRYKIEWYDISAQMVVPTRNDIPKPRFYVPNLYGNIYRINEYSESEEIFRAEGHYQYRYFSTSQATKIGTETYFIQSDPRQKEEELFCTFNSIDFALETKWPFVNFEKIEHDKDFKGYQGYQYENEISMGDVGCMYFLIDRNTKNIRWAFDCY